jgi:hypothetical protein
MPLQACTPSDLNVMQFLTGHSLVQVCYDWSKGAENHNPATAKTYIYLHTTQVILIVLGSMAILNIRTSCVRLKNLITHGLSK